MAEISAVFKREAEVAVQVDDEVIMIFSAEHGDVTEADYLDGDWRRIWP